MIAPVRLALVANPRSGAADQVADVDARLRALGADVEPVELKDLCDGPGPLDEAGVKRALDGPARGIDRVVVAGGDGSIGPAAALAARAGAPLAVIPTGTANDFARFLELPLEIDAAVELAARDAPQLRTAELADADGHPFVNAASGGLSVLAAHNARPLKARLGALAYAVGAVRAGLTGQPIALSVRVDGHEAWRGRAWQVVVAATGAFGGGSATGGVDTRDQALDVAVVEAGSRVALAKRAFAMTRGALVAEDEVAHLRGATVELELPPVLGMNVDGELLNPPPTNFRVAGAFQVVVSAGSEPR